MPDYSKLLPYDEYRFYRSMSPTQQVVYEQENPNAEQMPREWYKQNYEKGN